MMDEHGPLREEYEVRAADVELRCMDMMMQVLMRHLLPTPDRPASEQEMEPARRAVRWLSARIGA